MHVTFSNKFLVGRFTATFDLYENQKAQTFPAPFIFSYSQILQDTLQRTLQKAYIPFLMEILVVK